jgi:FkbM family methyltransferase
MRDGFYELDTPGALITHWGLMVERELDSPIWIKQVRGASEPFIVDVGANHGAFVLRCLRINPNAFVQAIEPQAGLTDRLYCVGAREVFCAAAGAAHRYAYLYSQGTGDVCASLYPTKGEDTQQDGVCINPLDAMVEDRVVDVLKIDAEGHGIQVLEGASNTLENTQVVLIELTTRKEVLRADKLLKAFPYHVQLSPIDYLWAKAI